jgi:membrane associated rhomboid family serine protease
MGLVRGRKPLAQQGMTPAGPPAPHPVTGLPLVLLVLLLANVLPELILQLSDRGLVAFPGLRNLCYTMGAFQPDLLTGPGPLFSLQPLTMFFTYGFLHTGLTHLVINMGGLIWLGRLILSYRTSESFVLFYLMSMIGAAELFSLIGAGTGITVGASGALFGLFGVYAIDAGFLASAKPTNEETSLQFFRLSLATVVLALSDLASQSLLGSLSAWQAHTGGFLTGAVMALLSPPRYRMPR